MTIDKLKQAKKLESSIEEERRKLERIIRWKQENKPYISGNNGCYYEPNEQEKETIFAILSVNSKQRIEKLEKELAEL